MGYAWHIFQYSSCSSQKLRTIYAGVKMKVKTTTREPKSSPFNVNVSFTKDSPPFNTVPVCIYEFIDKKQDYGYASRKGISRMSHPHRND